MCILHVSLGSSYSFEAYEAVMLSHLNLHNHPHVGKYMTPGKNSALLSFMLMVVGFVHQVDNRQVQAVAQCSSRRNTEESLISYLC